MNMQRFARFAFLLAAAMLCAGSVHAQNFAWSASVGGTEEQVWLCTHHLAGGDCSASHYVPDTGSVIITVNGQSVSAAYGSTSTDLSLNQALCAAMTSSFPIQCSSATASGMTGGSNQANADYTIVGSSTTNYPYDSGSGVNEPRGPSFSAGGTSTVSGFVNPKYVILGVTYAPPGNQSYVQYAGSTLVGTSTSLNGSFATDVGLKVAVSSTTGANGTLPDIGGTYGWSDTQTDTYSQNFTVESDTSSSVAISSQDTWTTKVPGPADPYAGVDHDYDIIWLWLNPLLNFSIDPSSGANSLIWTGYGFDADDVHEMDIYGVYLGWLTGRLSSPGPGTSDFTPLARAWAGQPSNGQIWPAGATPSLLNAAGTAIDPATGATIAAADPFSDANYTVTIPAGSETSSDGRFTLTGNQTVDYVQPGPGGQPYTQTLAESTTTTQTQGQGAKFTIELGYSWENKFTASFLENSWSTDVTTSDTLTYINQWSTTNTETTAETATGSVTGPPCTVVGAYCSPVYTGPTEYEVLQDNIYNTFMYYPVN
jgi:hypothetical protein